MEQETLEGVYHEMAASVYAELFGEVGTDGLTDDDREGIISEIQRAGEEAWQKYLGYVFEAMRRRGQELLREAHPMSMDGHRVPAVSLEDNWHTYTKTGTGRWEKPVLSAVVFRTDDGPSEWVPREVWVDDVTGDYAVADLGQERMVTLETGDQLLAFELIDPSHDGQEWLPWDPIGVTPALGAEGWAGETRMQGDPER